MLHLAERIRQNVEDHPFDIDIGNGQTINKTCSLGVVTFPFISEKYDALTWQQTLNLADMALYAAKSNGRNAWVFLYQDQLSEVQEFYQQARNDLQSLVDTKVVSYKTSIVKKEIKFLSNVHDLHKK